MTGKEATESIANWSKIGAKCAGREGTLQYDQGANWISKQIRTVSKLVQGRNLNKLETVRGNCTGKRMKTGKVLQVALFH